MTKKWQLVDLVRSFSILSVMAAHAASFVRPLGNSQLEQIVKRFEQNGGGYGVLIFFVVSGFLISSVLDRQTGGLFHPTYRKFYTQRVGRIFPLYFAAVLLGVLAVLFLPPDPMKVQYCFGSNVFHRDPCFWLSIFTFTLTWLMTFQGLGLAYGLFWNLLWSLSIEEQFYLLFPMILKKTGKPRALMGVLFSLLILSFLTRLGIYRGFFQAPLASGLEFLSAFDMIAAGVLLYLARRTWGAVLDEKRGVSILMSVTGFFWVLAVFFFTSSQDAFERIYSLPLLGLGVAVFLMGGLSLAFFDGSFLKPLSWPGKFCYGMYLLHPFVLFLCGSLLVRMAGPAAFALFFGLTALLAGISFHFFESPVNRLIRCKFAEEA